MPDFTFLHAADLHLDSPLRGLDADAPSARIRGATRQALIRMIDAALERQVGFVLLAGDLYDGAQKDWRSGRFLTEQLSRLVRAGIEIVSISGNHDAESLHTARLAVPGMLGADAAETRLLERYPVAVHGQSFPTREVKANIVRDYPVRVEDRFNIGLLHTACGQGGHEDYAPCTLDDLALHGYDYWALGHIHARSVLSRDPWVVFPGVLQGRHINEEGDKGATFVTVAGGRVQAAEHVAFDVLRWRRISVNVHGASSMEAVLGRVRHALDGAALLSEGRMLAVRLTLVGECPVHAALVRSPAATLEQVRAAAQDVAGRDDLWIEDVRVETAPPSLAGLHDHPGVIGALLAALDRPGGADADLVAFAKDQLKRTGDALPADHPARLIAEGVVPDDLLARARALVLAELKP